MLTVTVPVTVLAVTVFTTSSSKSPKSWKRFNIKNITSHNSFLAVSRRNLAGEFVYVVFKLYTNLHNYRDTFPKSNDVFAEHVADFPGISQKSVYCGDNLIHRTLLNLFSENSRAWTEHFNCLLFSTQMFRNSIFISIFSNLILKQNFWKFRNAGTS